MRYPAQVETAIELFAEIETSGAPADKYMAGFFRARRYIGSKDKGVVADLVYMMMRRLAEIDYLITSGKGEVNGRFRMLVALFLSGKTKEFLLETFSGEQYAPKALSKHELTFVRSLDVTVLKKASHYIRFNYADWMTPLFRNAFGADIDNEMKALNGRADSDIRVNTLKVSRKVVLAQLQEQGFEMENTPYSPLGLRMEGRRSLFSTDAFLNGWFEMQDEGSQLIAAFAQVKPKTKVVDFCAGAGGKTLALAAAMDNKGVLHALDINERRLGEMPKRTKRAGVHNVTPKVLTSEHDKWVKRHKGTQDTVLVDAPCTGTGTWRRSPDARWRLSPADLENILETQASVLASASRLVKDGGRLVYATCSVLASENEDQIHAFLEEHEDFKLVDARTLDVTEKPLPAFCYKDGMVHLSPYKTGTDGFFIAVLERTC